jgi:penicillin-binding protein 2
LLDKVIGVQAAPGSIFKLVSAYAALEKGIIEPESMYYSNGCMKIGDHSFCEYGKFALGNLDLRNAIKRSSNIYFCQSSLKLANEQGIPALVNAAADLGIGKKTGIIFEGEASGVMASPEYKSRVFGERWFGGDTCNTAIGQGMVATTPMQMAMVVGTLANSGIRLAPNVIKEISDQSGTFVSGGIAQELAKIPLAHSTEVAILDGMKMAAQEWGGTAAAFLADNPASFRIKTGSAEAVEGVHSWMVGTFQYQGRVFAFAAHIHFGGGSRNVIPVMDEFGNCLYANFPNYCL